MVEFSLTKKKTDVKVVFIPGTNVETTAFSLFLPGVLFHVYRIDVVKTRAIAGVCGISGTAKRRIDKHRTRRHF